jgi:hypothetical protein
MRTKNSIVMKTGGSLFSKGTGTMRHTLHTNLRDHLKHEKADSSVNNAVFGKIIGNKRESDNVKIGSFGSGEAKHISFIPEDNIAETLRKISFKEKKNRNNIVLTV